MRRDSEEDRLPPNKIQKNRFLAKAAVNSPGLERHSRRRNTAEIKHHLFRQPEISESAGENTPGCKMCYASLTAAAARRDGANGGGRRVLAHSTDDGMCTGIRKKTGCRQIKKPLSCESGCELAGARTRDPNIKSVVLYRLSYEFIPTEGACSVSVVQM